MSNRIVPLADGCTVEMLCHHLEELGEDVDELRKANPSFVELKRLYFDLLNMKLTELRIALGR
jgi:hypothetical protein